MRTRTALIGLLGLLAALAPQTATATAASAAQAHPALQVIPFPGTPDASPQSQIIFSSLRPSDLITVLVSGSTSKMHLGSLTALPDHAGTAFVPTEPFAAGERVTVNALLSSARAGTAAGDPGATSLHFSFTVAGAPASAGASHAAAHTSAWNAAQAHPVYRSEPRLTPPPVHVSVGPAPGFKDIFLSPRSQFLFGPPLKEPPKYQSGLMILNPRGQLVWFEPMAPTGTAFNLEVQRYREQPVLTYFETGGGQGNRDVILNRSYQPVAALYGGWGYVPDLHEFQLTPQGTALVDAVSTVRANLTGVGGPAGGLVNDYVIQELDIPTGRVLWEWHVLGHIPLRASEARPPQTGVYDAYHLNSIQQLPGHRLLVSIRHAWTVYEIDERTGRVIWALGGKHSSFRMGPGTRFQWQHDAHLQGNLLTLFDNAITAGGHGRAPQSSAKVLRLDARHHTVSLVHTYHHSPPLLIGAEGSAQLLSNHDLFVGWGTEPAFSQYTPGGRQIFSATFPLGVESYRAYRFSWTGHPLTAPALAVSPRRRGTVWLHASWNGATQVAAWRVLAGSGAQSLRAVRKKAWTGFETAVAVHTTARYLAVEALGAQGQVLRRSDVLAVPTG